MCAALLFNALTWFNTLSFMCCTKKYSNTSAIFWTRFIAGHNARCETELWNAMRQFSSLGSNSLVIKSRADAVNKTCANCSPEHHILVTPNSFQWVLQPRQLFSICKFTRIFRLHDRGITLNRIYHRQLLHRAADYWWIRDTACHLGLNLTSRPIGYCKSTTFIAISILCSGRPNLQ